MAKNKRIHFLLIYPLRTAPSQRYRFEQYFPLLDQCSFKYSTNCFYDRETHALLYKQGSKLKLMLRILHCYLRRCTHMLSLWKYDYLMIQRGAAPVGPPVFEWVARYLYRKPIIYDFDDAIWRQPAAQSSILKRWVKNAGKVDRICRWAAVVVTGNQYLAAYAQKFNKNVVVIPTVVDTENRFVPDNSAKNNGEIIVGWTGSHTTLAYLEELEPILIEVQKEYAFSLMIIANAQPDFKALKYHFVPWSEEAEVQELQKIDFGIMPLPDDEWTKGKCGFKAIQYMALEKPAVASAVGLNKEIIDHGVNGYLCQSHEDWKDSLIHLLRNSSLTRQLGIAARKKVEKDFSLRKAARQWCEVLGNV